MTDISNVNPLTEGNEELALIERGGTEVDREFVTQFNAMSPEQRAAMVETARRNVMADEFGWAAIFLEDPEVGPLLRRAVGPPAWSALKLKREIEKTNWWKSRTASQREWDQQAAFDPTTANSEVETQKRGLRQVASGFNASLTDEQLTQLATESLRSGWDANQIINAVASEALKGSGFGPDIRFGITGRSVRQTASNFGVPLSDDAADRYAEQLATGQITQQDFENIVRSRAKSLYPSLAADIDRGTDVATLVDPYREIAARTLGIPSSQIDFADPKWNAALNFDDGKGRRMMTLNEWADRLRRDESYGYDATPQAINKAYDMVDRLGRMFGVTA